jgi:hypothetical protein
MNWIPRGLILVSLCGATLPCAGAPVGDATDRVVAYVSHAGSPVSYTEAHALGPEALPELASLLRDDRYKNQWFVIVHAINFIGDPAGFPVVRDFIFDRFRGEVDDPTFQALYSVVLSMGPLAARSDSAFQFLIGGTDPSFWTKIHWTNAHHKGAYLRVFLSELSITQLGVSGRPAAVPVLERLMRAPFSSRQIGNIEDGLRIQREIEAVGLDRYYERLGKPSSPTDSLPHDMF